MSSKFFAALERSFGRVAVVYLSTLVTLLLASGQVSGLNINGLKSAALAAAPAALKALQIIAAKASGNALVAAPVAGPPQDSPDASPPVP
jgi:hypothetical protein